MKTFYDGSLTPQDAKVKHSLFATDLKNVKGGRIPDENIFSIRNTGLIFDEEKKSLLLLGVVYFHWKQEINILKILKKH